MTGDTCELGVESVDHTLRHDMEQFLHYENETQRCVQDRTSTHTFPQASLNYTSLLLIQAEASGVRVHLEVLSWLSLGQRDMVAQKSMGRCKQGSGLPRCRYVCM